MGNWLDYVFNCRFGQAVTLSLWRHYLGMKQKLPLWMFLEVGFLSQKRITHTWLWFRYHLFFSFFCAISLWSMCLFHCSSVLSTTHQWWI